MAGSVRENYLTAEVMSAPPQKLHLMLIEATLRSAHRARSLWRDHQDEPALESLLHAQEILNQLLGGMKREVSPDLVAKVASVYLFVYRRLVEAGQSHDETCLADAIRVLEIERETWRQVCEKLAAPAVRHEQDRPSAVPPPKFAALSGMHEFDLPAGLSLEA
jgi:flagellar secretion chaperone FliS